MQPPAPLPDPPLALVTGATGFVARTLIPALRAHGYRVRAALRSPCDGPWDESVVVGDLNNFVDWGPATAGVDAIWHLAARVHVMRETEADPLQAFRRVNVERTADLCAAARVSGVRRLVYLSSIKVNGEQTQPGRPFRPDDTPAPHDAYGVSKLEAEQAIRASGIESAIVRPPLIYGPGVGANFAQLVSAVSKGYLLPLGSVDNRRDLVFVGNLVDALVRIGEHPRAAGRTFLISDRAPMSTPELIRHIAHALQKRERLLRVPSPLLLGALTLLGKREEAQRLLGSLEVDTSDLVETLSWQPPYTVAEGLRATVGGR
ncbi:NAD-dependent epimerase/dehydratase family protein [Niveibacterium umoris]|uniref:Nucleoside-diphosphate-sugar epimerase n=1 Tax=Niveibacterium umoris TaxID=1193620 RepID=A0A840BLR3_9RHOO|nr:NAD-dependent epimerase/dehydratase family protein [Niveibacterium umoris]MBB4011427.1 nucleoside-diphosphate-sugar epimerase [Niveibacterium umoris]